MNDVWIPDSAKRFIPTPPGRPHWDRPPTVGTEEVANTRMLVEDGHVPTASILEGPMAKLDEARYLRGEVCLQCHHCLPECPSAPGAYKRILRADGFDIKTRYVGYPGEPLAKERLMAGRCPCCGTEMSPEIAAAMFAGEWDTKEGSAAWRDWAKDG